MKYSSFNSDRLLTEFLRWFVAALISVALVACSSSGSPSPVTDPPVTTEVEPSFPTTPATATTPVLSTLIPTTASVSKTPTPTIAKATELPSPTATQTISSTLVLGKSSQGWPIEAVRFGTGPLHVAFIGGIHGGYEWNTILLAYQAIDYFNANPKQVPPEVSLFIIPSANPDGQAKVIGHTGRFTPKEVNPETASGRFNSLGVDLNRNWDCNWEPDGFWRNQEVSAGEAPFSEAETQALRDFLSEPPMAGVVFWHSAVPGVYAGGCDTRYTPADALAEVYAEAAGYPFELKFTGYPVSGNAIDWLATKDIPGIEVELTNHRDTDWDKNLNGIIQILNYFQNTGFTK